MTGRTDALTLPAGRGAADHRQGSGIHINRQIHFRSNGRSIYSCLLFCSEYKAVFLLHHPAAFESSYTSVLLVIQSGLLWGGVYLNSAGQR